MALARQWLDRSLRNYLTGSLLLASLGLLALVALAVYALMLSSLREQANRDAELVLESASERAGVALADAGRELERLSRYPLVVNALTDTDERGAYLQPTLRTSRERLPGACALSLVDHRGRPLGENASAPDCRHAVKDAGLEVRTVEKAAAQHATTLSPDRWSIRIGYPVVFPATGSAEGAVVADIDLHRMLLPSTEVRGFHLGLFAAPAPEQSPTLLAHPRQWLVVERRVPLDIPGLGAQERAWMVARQDPGVLQSAFLRLTAAFLIGAVLVSLAAWALSRRLATRLAEPLVRLTQEATAGGDGAHYPPTITRLSHGPAELRRLSEAFADLVGVLHERNRQLDIRVDRETAHAMQRENQLAGVLQLSKDGFVVVNARNIVEYINPAFEQLTELDSWRFVGKEARHLLGALRAGADPAAPWPDLLSPTASFDADDASAVPVALQLRTPRAIFLVPTVWRSDRWAGTTVLHLRDATREIQLDAMKTQFLSTAAHELRTPITSIWGFAQILRDEAPQGSVEAEAASHIYRQCETLTLMVDDLLDLARMEARVGDVLHWTLADAASLLRETCNRFPVPEGRKPVALPSRMPSARVRVDAPRLRQAIGNLLANAYRYSRAPAPVRVRLFLAEEGPAMVGLQVEDEGIGMSPEELGHAFERFWRADPSGATPGSGLGLSIVKEIVDRLGGRVELASTPGAGTRATIWLPVIAPD